jgi:hypothetical protein
MKNYVTLKKISNVNLYLLIIQLLHNPKPKNENN